MPLYPSPLPKLSPEGGSLYVWKFRTHFTVTTAVSMPLMTDGRPRVSRDRTIGSRLGGSSLKRVQATVAKTRAVPSLDSSPTNDHPCWLAKYLPLTVNVHG